MFSLYPAAVTPIRASQLLNAVINAHKLNANKVFEQEICNNLGFMKGYPFQSLMRTTYACNQLQDNDRFREYAVS